MEIIRRITPEEEYNAGLTIFRQGGVHPLEDENGFLRYAVDGDPRRIVRVGATTKLSGRCSCDFFGNVHKPCRHLAAAMMQAISTGAIEEMRRRRARENAGALMGTLQSALPMETPLEMEITLRLLGEKEPVRVSLRVGQERMYVVKSMAQFLRGLQEKTAIAFGKGFVLEPEWMGFTGVDAKIIKLLQDAAYVCQLEGKLVQTGLDAKYLTVADRFVPRLMQLLMAKPFKISFGEEVVSVPSVFDACVTATARVRPSSSDGSSSVRRRPSSSKGSTRISAPLRSHSICHGTILEWCSISLTTMLSPARTNFSPHA